jgi:hypothetical protein
MWWLRLLNFQMCKSRAKPLQKPCKKPCKRRANAVQTPCKSRAKAVQKPCKSRAKAVQKPCKAVQSRGRSFARIIWKSSSRPGRHGRRIWFWISSSRAIHVRKHTTVCTLYARYDDAFYQGIHDLFLERAKIYFTVLRRPKSTMFCVEKKV